MAASSSSPDGSRPSRSGRPVTLRCGQGVTALESAGIEIDPVNQRLKKLPALRLKRVRG